MEERERGARSARAGSPARPPSPRLDVSSDSFDPLLALYAPHLPPIPYPNAPCFNNVAEYESFLRTGLRSGGRGRARGAAAGSGAPAAASAPSGRTRRRPDAPAPDPERIQRLRRLMVTKEEGDEAAEARRRGPGRSRKAPRNVLTRMPCESRGRAGAGRRSGRRRPCGRVPGDSRLARTCVCIRGRVLVKAEEITGHRGEGQLEEFRVCLGSEGRAARL